MSKQRRGRGHSLHGNRISRAPPPAAANRRSTGATREPPQPLAPENSLPVLPSSSPLLPQLFRLLPAASRGCSPTTPPPTGHISRFILSAVSPIKMLLIIFMGPVLEILLLLPPPPLPPTTIHFVARSKWRRVAAVQINFPRLLYFKTRGWSRADKLPVGDRSARSQIFLVCVALSPVYVFLTRRGPSPAGV